MAKRELLATIRDRYRASSRKEKSRILDEFIAELTSSGNRHHREHGIGSVPSSIRVRSQAFFVGLSGLVVTRPVAPTASLCELLR